jgi:hypothetical protein
MNTPGSARRRCAHHQGVSLTAGAKVLTPLAPDQALAKYGDWRSIAETRRGRVCAVGPNNHHTRAVPDRRDRRGRHRRVALKPTRNAGTIDDDLFEEWVTTIASGVRALMLKTSNPKSSQIHAGLYD